MDKTKLMQRLMATFLEELDEHVRSFNSDLLTLEKALPPEEKAERFKTLFRTAHSLKGAARAVQVQPIETQCHHLEDILEGVRDGNIVLGRELGALLFTTVDAIEEAGMRLREQQNLVESPLTALIPRLEAAAKAKKNTHVPVKEALTLPSMGSPDLPAVPSRSSGTEPVLETSVASSSVRVPVAKLDSLLAGVGELMVAQRRIETYVSQIAACQDLVSSWKAEWKRIEPFLTKERGASNGDGGSVKTVRRNASCRNKPCEPFGKRAKKFGVSRKRWISWPRRWPAIAAYSTR